MTLNISVPNSTQELRPKITVVGVGGAGGNAVNNMISANLEGVDFLAANTDGQALATSLAERKIQLGRQQTQGLGAGSKPEVGRIAAEESIDDILAELADSHMVFITAGMGGGTGTGAAPVIAKACRERGILTVGVITKPFDFEGQGRMIQANAGIEELQAYVDTLIIIPNQNLFRLANEKTTFADAFAMADEVLHQGVCGITDLMVKPGTINLDFADIRSVMAEMGKAMMGTGEASGDNRATNAAEAAINNPLLDETSMKGAQAVLINITGGSDMTLFEVDEAANHIRREVDADATIIFGSALDERMDGIMRVSVVATGIESGSASETPPANETASMVRHFVKPQRPKPAAATGAAPAAAAAAAEEPAEAASDTDPAGTAPDDIPEVPGWRFTGAAAEMPAEAPVEVPEETPVETSAAAAEAPADTAGKDADFALSEPAPTAESDPEASGAEVEGYFSDDPKQSNLMDIVETGDAAGKPAEDEPFIPAETSEPEGEVPATGQQGGLISHLAKAFSRKPAKQPGPQEARVQTEPVMTEAPAEAAAEAGAASEAGSPAGTGTAAEAGVAAEAEAPVEAPVEALAQAAPEAPAEPAGSSGEAEEAPAAEEGGSGGLAGLEPAPREQMEIDTPAEDIDLEIPAFLRRQAN